MRTPLIAGNWKMNGTRASNAALIDGIVGRLGEAPGVEVLVCPPAAYLEQVANGIGGASVALGAQDVSEYDKGAYTGELSATMLAELGCRYVLVGHSERRSLFAELNEQVASKFAAAVEQDLTPVLCVGETLAQRQEGETEAVVLRQLDAVLELVGIEGFRQGVVAYEPVWAIGTGETATPQQAQDPIEITQRGSGIWSYTLRSAGAILLTSVPATIITSDWRGLGRKTMPNRSRS